MEYLSFNDSMLVKMQHINTISICPTMKDEGFVFQYQSQIHSIIPGTSVVDGLHEKQKLQTQVTLLRPRKFRALLYCQYTKTYKPPLLSNCNAKTSIFQKLYFATRNRHKNPRFHVLFIVLSLEFYCDTWSHLLPREHS